MTTFAIRSIQPNPFRHMDRYPIRRDKVEILKASYRTTGFWDNVVARLGSGGKPEIAYGHHRLVALQEEFGPNQRVELIVRDIDDAQMLRIMADENMDEWGTSAAVEHETVRAVIEAYAEGLIRLDPPKGRKDEVRWAPSFIPGEGADLLVARRASPYSAQSLAAFLGWITEKGTPRRKIYNALTALELIEEGLLFESQFVDLSSKQAEAVIEQARQARDSKAARHQRAEAERATAEARRAEQQAVEAKRREEAATKKAKVTRTPVERRRHEEEAKHHADERRKALEAQQRAEERRRHAQAEAARKTAEGRERATKVGRAVSESLREGKTGYRQAREVAERVAPRTKDIPDIHRFADRVATYLGNVFDEKRNNQAQYLKEVIRYREHLRTRPREDLARSLDEVARQATELASELRSSSSSPASNGDHRALPAGRR